MIMIPTSGNYPTGMFLMICNWFLTLNCPQTSVSDRGFAGVPRTGPTAWALLALRDHADRAEVQMSLSVLEGSYATIHGAASLALAHRCLLTYGRRVPPLASALNELYSHNHFFENMLTMAWAALALREEEISVQ